MATVTPPTLFAQLMARRSGEIRRPVAKIAGLEMSVTIVDNAGGIASGTIDPWGVPAIGAIAERLTDNELFARVACMNIINGTSLETLHNIINLESAVRAQEWLDKFNRTPAV